MKLKSIGVFLTVILLPFGFEVAAQSYTETAGLFSRVTPGGSARIQGIGGAQISLGGDYSSALSNPAGLGMYNRSEITFSPGFYTQKTNSSYLNTPDSDVKTNLNIPGFSVVLNNMRNNEKGFLGGSFAISFSRINDFNQSIQYHGSNQYNSIADFFINDANGYDKSQFDEGQYMFNTPTGLAYDNYIIGDSAAVFPNTSNTQYFSDLLPTKDNPALQNENVHLTGASNQWNISYGANIDDWIFLGAGIGITSLNYKSSKVYRESYASDQNFSGMQLNENLTIKGSGANFSLGGILRPVKFVQFGASYTTPTLYQLYESYGASMSSSWKSFDYYGDNSKILNQIGPLETDIVKSDYSLVTPSKLSTGLTLICKYGFLSGDLETMNYGGSRYSTSTEGVSYTTDNQLIKSTYKRVLNYRVGAEGRYSIFRLRAGYNVQANTYKSEYDVDNTIKSISGGVGVKLKKYSIDFALISSSRNGTYSPYNVAPTVFLTNNLVRGVFTFAATF